MQERLIADTRPSSTAGWPAQARQGHREHRRALRYDKFAACNAGGSAMLPNLNVYIVTTATNSHFRLYRQLISIGITWAQYGGVDMRNVTSSHLFQTRKIGIGAALDLDEGRTRHHDLASAGAVGCWLSHMAAITAGNSSAWTLVLEDDVAIDRPSHFFSSICQIMRHSEAHRNQFELDAVVLAPEMIRDGPSWRPTKVKGNWVTTSFISPQYKKLGVHRLEKPVVFRGTAAMLWSPQGKARVAEELFGRPVDVRTGLF